MNTAKIFILLACTLLLTVGCSKNQPNTVVVQEPNPIPTTNTPVETNPPNTNYNPAFQGQTRIKSAKTTTVIQANAITTALSSPWASPIFQTDDCW